MTAAEVPLRTCAVLLVRLPRRWGELAFAEVQRTPPGKAPHVPQDAGVDEQELNEQPSRRVRQRDDRQRHLRSSGRGSRVTVTSTQRRGINW